MNPTNANAINGDNDKIPSLELYKNTSLSRLPNALFLSTVLIADEISKLTNSINSLITISIIERIPFTKINKNLNTIFVKIPFSTVRPLILGSSEFTFNFVKSFGSSIIEYCLFKGPILSFL